MEDLRAANSEGAGNNSGRLLGITIARPNSCPYAPECQSLISELSAPETADCYFCGQTFNRTELIRYLEGTP